MTDDHAPNIIVKTDGPIDDGRPDPLGRAVATAGPAPAAFGGLLTALLAGGFLTQAGVSIITVGLSIAAIATTMLGSYLTARRVASAARPDVTPSDDPRDDTGTALVPAGAVDVATVLAQLQEQLTSIASAVQPNATAPDPAQTAPLAQRAAWATPPPPQVQPGPPVQSPAYADMLAREDRADPNPGRHRPRAD